MTTRRNLLHVVRAAKLALTFVRRPSAQTARLDEADPVAVSVGYKHDASKVEGKNARRMLPGAIAPTAGFIEAGRSLRDLWRGWGKAGQCQGLVCRVGEEGLNCGSTSRTVSLFPGGVAVVTR